MGNQTIFISHIKEEVGLARIFKDLIQEAFIGLFDAFVSSDGRSIPLGNNWLQEIEGALFDSKMVVVLCSKASVKRPWINFEAGAGWLNKLPILTICHSGMEADDLPSPLNVFQTVCTSDEECIKIIIERIAKIMGSHIPAVNYPLVMEKVRAFESENAGSIFEADKLKYEDSSLFDMNVLALTDSDKTLLMDVVNANLVTKDFDEKKAKQGSGRFYIERNPENINRLKRLRNLGYVTVSDEVVYPGNHDFPKGANGKSIINIKSIYTTNKGFTVVCALRCLEKMKLIQLNAGETEVVNVDDAGQLLDGAEGEEIRTVEEKSYLKDCYYKECKITVDCYVKENYIEKTIHKHMSIVNPTKSEKKVFVPFSVEMEPLKNANISEIYDITEFKVNEKDCLSEVRNKLKRTAIIDGTTLKMDSEYDISLCDDSCVVDVETISKVPLEDKHFTHQLTMPCKNYIIEFRLLDDNYRLSGYSFGQFVAGEKRETKKEFDNTIEIAFDDWLEPKNGVVFIIDKK